ncbi:hypothetical protein SBA1_470023 [Candidatus Sulfotelmatobacter kueseliae]|uniref:Uncharacterized protein n=1 Tax=Candidatus Sulfotelmatobacter kueseliae TaxID=2042962 RepID=A0A2U3KT10_9BACT|nr:hypothetical protein SBA1_470023 [Candidatus Sulfotelmatobacter kueseliae]
MRKKVSRLSMRSIRHFLPHWSHIPLKTNMSDTSGPPGAPASPVWRGLYVAALFEKDEQRMVGRIAEAKSALVVRARELFQTPEDHLQEQSAIDDAFQALHALEQCAEHTCVRHR